MQFCQSVAQSHIIISHAAAIYSAHTIRREFMIRCVRARARARELKPLKLEWDCFFESVAITFSFIFVARHL